MYLKDRSGKEIRKTEKQKSYKETRQFKFENQTRLPTKEEQEEKWDSWDSSSNIKSDMSAPTSSCGASLQFVTAPIPELHCWSLLAAIIRGIVREIKSKYAKIMRRVKLSF